MKATGFLGASNVTEYNVKLNGVAFDLDAAGVTKLQVVDNGVSIDSDSSAVSFTGSTVSIEWGALALASGQYSPTIYAYKAGDVKGEVIYGPGLESINLTLVEDERPA